ncbi:cupin domain-containing protein [Devosia ginsengisoli]|uniref:cupin domain-containing protein n=1 Tax=Devosia ginsengisoli TaxID=400770 RepID=UPI0026F0DDFD|nr:cupin domain-containing protein [Devosia ginsengisoli]MCR6672677.1 cupin domain-containing protein [Devosia ginsengisoli]
MTAARRDIINIADVPTRTFHSGPRFEAALGDIDGALGTTQIGATLHVVPAGKTAWPYHRHHGNDELYFVVSGSGTYRIGDRRLPIRAGDLIGAPAGGEAHQIINSSDAELRYVAFANHGRADVIEYPDTGRVSVDIAHGNDKEPMSVFSIAGKLSPLDYWEGEDMGEGEKP